MTDQVRRYYLINRPPEYGHMPEGFTGFEVWSPVRRIPDQPEGFEHTAHGWVEYRDRLSVDQVYRFDLHPADRVEFAESWFYRDDRQRWESNLEEYLSAGVEWLRENQEDDYLAYAALVIWESINS